MPAAPTAARRAPSPYLRVKHYLKEGLARGDWLPGTLMPSEAELVARFGISRMTVNRALRELQTEGFVQRTQGVGTFAAHLYRVSSTLTIRDMHDEIESQGHRHEVRVHLKRRERAPAALAAQLGLATGDDVFHSVIVHLGNGQPLQCEDRYVNPRAVPDYLEVDFEHTTPTQHLLAVAPLWQAQYTIQAGHATPEEARLLGIPASEPCLILVRRTVDRGTPVTLVRLVHPGTRYQIEGHFSP